MLSKIGKFIIKHKFVSVAGLGLIVAGAYFSYQRLSEDGNVIRYVTAAVEKGSLIISVSGSGQVSALDQVDIKPKVSGELTALYIAKDQEVKQGQLLAEINTKTYQQAVYDAEIALDEAKEKLDELLSLPDEKSVRDAEIALNKAERDLNKAKEAYENIETDIEGLLAETYEDGYNTVAGVFINLSAYMQGLKDVLGTERYELDYVDDYKLILGRQSLFIQRLVDDYYQVIDSFNKSHNFFVAVFQDDNRDTIYQLISDTLETTRAVSRALDSARHMFDAILAGSAGYKQLSIASHINKIKPKIESCCSAVSSDISSLQRIKETIDDTVKNGPQQIEDAKWALQTAQDKFDEKKSVLEETAAGAEPKDIRAQQNIIIQKENALSTAKENLADCSVRAPFDGIIAEFYNKIRKGDSVSSNTVLATLITKQKIAVITLNEIDIAKVKPGQKATINLDALEDLNITGQVVEVDGLGTVAQGVVTYDVKIALDAQNEQIKPGMSLSAAIITNFKPDVLLAPSSAIKQQGEVFYVQTADSAGREFNSSAANISGSAVLPSNLRTQQVELGLSNDTMTEIISGLQEGDIVVVQTINSSSYSQNQSQQSPGVRSDSMPGGNSMNMMRIIR